MSKSKGNTVEPQTITKESGAEILRLWAAMVDYSEDQRIGKTILATTTDAYRKLRNTTRYLLGALAGFDEAERVTDYADFPPLEKYILHRLWELDGQVKAAYEAYRFSDVIRPLIDFCQGDLSSLFFDIRKDSLYCDAPNALRRRAYRTVLDHVFERLTVWLSPLTSFTMEEAWTTRFPDAGSNVLRVMPETPAAWRNDAEAARWAKVETVTSVVTSALEVERRDKRIGSALEAAPVVHIAEARPAGRLRRPGRGRGVPHQRRDPGRRRCGRGLRPGRGQGRGGRAAGRGQEVRPLVADPAGGGNRSALSGA
jgi:isoleucyl-tRNA synthetase